MSRRHNGVAICTTANPLWPVDLRRTLDLAGSGQAQCHGSPDTIARLRAGGQAERAVEGVLQLVLQTRHVLPTGDDVQPLDWTQEAGGGRRETFIQWIRD